MHVFLKREELLLFKLVRPTCESIKSINNYKSTQNGVTVIEYTQGHLANLLIASS